MQIYNYHPKTNEYLDSIERNEDSVPAGATKIAPPACRANEKPIFINGKWEITADFRNVDYWLPTSLEKFTIEKLGEKPPKEALYKEEDLPLKLFKDNLKNIIDGNCQFLMSILNSFKEDYSLKTAQALNFQKANYTGEVPSLIKIYAKFTGISEKNATDKIIAKDTESRELLEKIIILRMQKNLINNIENRKKLDAFQKQFFLDFEKLKEEVEAI